MVARPDRTPAPRKIVLSKPPGHESVPARVVRLACQLRQNRATIRRLGRRGPRVWTVTSQSGAGGYTVTEHPTGLDCGCGVAGWCAHRAGCVTRPGPATPHCPRCTAHWRTLGGWRPPRLAVYCDQVADFAGRLGWRGAGRCWRCGWAADLTPTLAVLTATTVYQHGPADLDALYARLFARQAAAAHTKNYTDLFDEEAT